MQDREQDIKRIKSIKLEKDISTVKASNLSQRGRRKVGRPQTNRMDVPLLTKPGPHWQTVKPPLGNKHREKNLACEVPAQNQFEVVQNHKPRIWASTQSELYDIFPGISKSINGVSWESLETPFLVLEGPAWPGDDWFSSTTIRLSMVRDFSCDKSALGSPSVNITPSEVFHRHYDDTHTNSPAVFFTRNESFLKRATIVPRTDSTSTCILCRDCPFVNSTEYHEDLSAMRLSISSSNMLANDNNRGSKIREDGVIPPDLAVPPLTPHRSSHVMSRQDCKICGIDTGTSHSMKGVVLASMRVQVAPVPSQIQAFSDVPFWAHKIDATDQFGNIDRDVSNNELTLPSYMGENMSSLLQYPLNIEYTVSNMRRGLPDPEVPDRFSISDQDGPTEELTLLYPSNEEDNISSLLRYPLNMDYTMSNTRGSFSEGDGFVPYRQSANSNPPMDDNWNNRSNPRSLDRRIPTSYPPEIQALVDAHISGMPIAIISSGDSPLSPVALPPEFGYSFLGFFFLTNIQAERIDTLTPDSYINGQEIGRILWKLRFHWTSGGEDFLPDGENLTTPWWAPASQRPETSSAVQSTPYMDRKDLLRNCHNLLPLSVLSGEGPHAAGGLFPKGWYCTNCGKLNKQVFLRHRKCTSSVCQKLIAEKKQVITGYAERLEHSRDCMQTPALLFPADSVPKTVSSLLSTWTDGMHTYCYSIKNHVRVKHIFTANLQSLQGEANVLFRDIQMHVELIRQPKGAGYFSHFVTAGSNENPVAMTWQKAPSCLSQARDLMIHQGRTYGETAGCSINQLSTLAWITTGRGKGPVIHARTGVATVLCLGADAILSLTPNSGLEIRETPAVRLFTGADDMSVDLRQDEENHESLSPTVGQSSAAEAKEKTKTVCNNSKDPFVVTMVHGDVLVFVGDDFKVHIKRTGTTILLVGENVLLTDDLEIA